MAKTLGCADVGYECDYRITAANEEEQLIVDTTLKHAEKNHPELMEDPEQLSETLRQHIRNLYQQAGIDPDNA